MMQRFALSSGKSGAYIHLCSGIEQSPMHVPHHHFALLFLPLLSVYWGKALAQAQPAQCKSMQCQRDMPFLNLGRGEALAG